MALRHVLGVGVRHSPASVYRDACHHSRHYRPAPPWRMLTEGEECGVVLNAPLSGLGISWDPPGVQQPGGQVVGSGPTRERNVRRRVEAHSCLPPGLGCIQRFVSVVDERCEHMKHINISRPPCTPSGRWRWKLSGREPDSVHTLGNALMCGGRLSPGPWTGKADPGTADHSRRWTRPGTSWLIA
jgi:hypothetical protein